MEWIQNNSVLITAFVTGLFGLLAALVAGWFGHYRGKRSDDINEMAEMRQMYVSMNQSLTDDYNRKRYELEEERNERATERAQWEIERGQWEVERSQYVANINQLTAELELLRGQT